MARRSPDEEFARGGLGAFAVDPTVQIAVLPGDPSSQPTPAESPEAVISKAMTPGGRPLLYYGIVRGTQPGRSSPCRRISDGERPSVWVRTGVRARRICLPTQTPGTASYLLCRTEPLSKGEQGKDRNGSSHTMFLLQGRWKKKVRPGYYGLHGLPWRWIDRATAGRDSRFA